MIRRLLFTYLGLTLAILASLEVPLAINYGDRLRSDLSSDLVRDGFAVAGFAEDTVEGAGAGTVAADLGALARSYADRTGARLLIVDAAGRVLADSRPTTGNDDFSSRPEIGLALRGEVATGTRRSDTLNTELLYVAVPIASGGKVHGAVRITYATDQLNERWRDFVLSLLAIAVVSMMTAALVGVLFARWVATPIRRLEAVAAELGAGTLSTRADANVGPPEVRRLAAEFNAMANRLDDLVEAQQAFVADASHQLRTPLAALRLRIENLQSDLDDVTWPSDDASARATAAARDDLDAVLTETGRMTRIVDGLLALARADRSGVSDAISLGLAEILEDRRAAWEPLAAEHGVDIDVEPTTLVARATEDRLVQVLDNLIANALEASSPTGRVRLWAIEPGETLDASAPRMVELHVTDQGPGMAEDQRARAFDRFWREHAAPRRLGSSGLGLSIARQLVRADQGDIELREAAGGGLDAVVSLPPG